MTRDRSQRGNGGPRLLLAGLVLAVVLFLTGCDSQPAKRLKVGDSAPDFAVTDLAGNPVALADFQGRPLVIRFFLPDCKYCKADTAVFNRFYADYRDRGVQIIYVSTVASRQELEDFANQLAIQFPVVWDKDGSLSAAFNIKVVPQAIILDQQHTIKAALLGGVSREELLELLQLGP